MVETTRGCPFSCNFCSVTTFFGRSFRHRPPAEVVAEIESLDKKFVFLVDDNIVADKEAAKELDFITAAQYRDEMLALKKRLK